MLLREGASRIRRLLIADPSPMPVVIVVVPWENGLTWLDYVREGFFFWFFWFV